VVGFASPATLGHPSQPHPGAADLFHFRRIVIAGFLFMDDLYSELKDIANMVRRYVEQLAGEGVDGINASAPVSSAGAGVVGKEDALSGIGKEVASCRKCRLSETRKHTVFGLGAGNARLVLVGEAPGAEEDRQGLPFVGRAGKLLTKMLAAIELEREEVYITNVLKCRPPNNRDPQEDEVECCEPYLIAQLQILNPALICALGRHAAQTLLKTGQGINKLRGKFYDYHGIKLLPTFHPAYLLRNPADKKKAWEDLQKVRDFLNSAAARE
jgi:DNA polymerase